MDSYDLVIIGSGAAGVSAATAAAHLGVPRIAMIERGPLWGTCVNVGCIPSKFLLTQAGFRYYKNGSRDGIATEYRFPLDKILSEKQALIDRQKQRKTNRLLTGFGVELIEGQAEFISSHELRIGEKTLTGRRFIIATGSSPSVPPIKGIETVPYMTNVEALSPDRIPSSLLVIGGRALGLEFAQLYAHMGSEVTLLQRSPRIIPEEEPEISDLLSSYLRAEGIAIYTGVQNNMIHSSPQGISMITTISGTERRFTAERILLATGRIPNAAALRLEHPGVKTGKDGVILVDSMMRTSAPHVWAAGDVVGDILETAARMGGEIAAINAIKGENLTFDRSSLPYGIFTTPQVSGVGMTEVQARQSGFKTVSRCIQMSMMSRPVIEGDTRGMVKIVADESGGRILGVHICAPLATEMIQEGVLAVKHRLTIVDLQESLHVFPTATEALQVCARKFRKKGGDCFG